MNNVCLVGGIGKANNIFHLQCKVEVIGKWDIYENNQLKGVGVKLNKMKIPVRVIYLLLQAFIQRFGIFFLWIDHLGGK